MCADRPAGYDLAALVDGYRGTALLYAAVGLNLPERMGTRSWTAPELAAAIGSRSDPLYRLLRGLAAVGVCDEDTDGHFTLAARGRELCSAASSGLREKVILAVEQYWPAWISLAACTRSGEDAFTLRSGMNVWEYRRRNPAQNETFNSWLAKETSSASIVAAIDVGAARRVADIGGGDGGLLLGLLDSHPGLTGILFDQPHVIEPQCAPEARPELELVSGDFMTAVPVRADLYLLKSILHDWDDEACALILANCRAAMASGARLLVIERILPTAARDDPESVLLDLHMMAVTGGRERTLAELRTLIEAAGFATDRIGMCASGHTLIEGSPL